MFDKPVPTPMLSVMVCPSLKPKSSLGPESPSWALLLISFSCFTHLQGRGRHVKHTISTDTEINNASQQFSGQLQHAAHKQLSTTTSCSCTDCLRCKRLRKRRKRSLKTGFWWVNVYRKMDLRSKHHRSERTHFIPNSNFKSVRVWTFHSS